jgi:hypothetical protein
MYSNYRFAFVLVDKREVFLNEIYKHVHYTSESPSVEQSIVPRTYNDGSILLGTPRASESTMSFTNPVAMSIDRYNEIKALVDQARFMRVYDMTDPSSPIDMGSQAIARPAISLTVSTQDKLYTLAIDVTLLDGYFSIRRKVLQLTTDTQATELAFEHYSYFPSTFHLHIALSERMSITSVHLVARSLPTRGMTISHIEFGQSYLDLHIDTRRGGLTRGIDGEDHLSNTLFTRGSSLFRVQPKSDVIDLYINGISAPAELTLSIDERFYLT